MPSANKTPNIGLNQWQGNEYPKREDFVSDNLIIDETIATLKGDFENIDMSGPIGTHNNDTNSHPDIRTSVKELGIQVNQLPNKYADKVHEHMWNEIVEKPISFPPSSHTQDWNTITGKPTTFQPINHSHTIGDVVGLRGELDNLKSSVVSGKQQVVNAINGKIGYSSGLTTNSTNADYAWWITNKLDSRVETLINLIKIIEKDKNMYGVNLDGSFPGRRLPAILVDFVKPIRLGWGTAPSGIATDAVVYNKNNGSYILACVTNIVSWGFQFDGATEIYSTDGIVISEYKHIKIFRITASTCKLKNTGYGGNWIDYGNIQDMLNSSIRGMNVIAQF